MRPRLWLPLTILGLLGACNCGSEPATGADAGISRIDADVLMPRDSGIADRPDAMTPAPDSARPDAATGQLDASAPVDAGLPCPGGCDDQNACTEDFCDVTGVCQHYSLADGTSCADGDVCNGSETCMAGTCTPGTNLANGTICGTNMVCDSAGCVALADYEWARWPMPPESPNNYSIGTDTVTDIVTGLIWQRAVPSQTHDWVGAQGYCASLNLGGTAGWRLPTIIELQSITDLTKGYPNSTIDSTAFPGTPKNHFYSSTPYAGRSGWAWDFDFGSGEEALPTDGTTSTYAVRCVWTPYPAASVSSVGAPAGQYTLAVDTVFDCKTGLTWERAGPAQTYGWADAKDYCAALSLGGFNSGWRLPTTKELATLVDRRVASPGPAIDSSAFPSTPGTCFWTSTPVANTANQVWGVYFGDGHMANFTTAGSQRARCVH